MADVPTVYTILNNLNQSLPNIGLMITGGGYIFGVALIAGAIYKLRMLGESRMMMSPGQIDIKGSMLTIVIGAVLIWLPQAFKVASMTAFGTDSPLSYSPYVQTNLDNVVIIALRVMKLVGVVAFIRGLLLINRATDGNSQQGTLGKGVTHVIGGVLAFHLYYVFQVIEATFGINIMD